MVTSSRTPPPTEHRLARQARERFVNQMDGGIVEMMAQAQSLLTDVMNGGLKTASVSEMQLAIETSRVFQAQRQNWVAALRTSWRESLTQPKAPTQALGKLSFELVDDSVVERKIVATRLASKVNEAAGTQINDLKLRIQHLERRDDWSAQDVLRPETLAQGIVQAWEDCGLTMPMWKLVQPAFQATLAKRMTDAYQVVNQFLIENGVLPQIDFKSMVRRDGQSSGFGAGPGTSRPAPLQHPQYPSEQMSQPTRPMDMSGSRMMTAQGARQHMHSGPVTQTAYAHPSDLARAAQETRMMTGMSPMVRMRERAQGVLGQLRRLISDRVADFALSAPGGPPSPQLAQALAAPEPQFAVTELMDRRISGVGGELPAGSVDAVAQQLRRRASELKTKAEKPNEKAIIEIVSLMFQAILAEERIPAALRIWFARLQIPVLRLALAEPDFFASVQHPARQLIDRMGACALGFDAAHISGGRLEQEIKRIVQMVEQYPETGRRVYQLVLDEFKKFLGKSLTENKTVQQAATLAQQVEQKEALGIQYTIELRRLLDPLNVSENVREFLFRVWSEVLAVSAVRHGAKHPETLRFKKAASDLLWSVSPRQDRAERTRVVQQLAGIIAVLRDGMTTLAMAEEEQTGHIKLINEAVMQAFVSRAASIDPAKLAELASSLAGLEDVVTDDPEGDVLLDPGMIEMMFGVPPDELAVIAEGGSMPGPGMLQWAQQLDLGNWFQLDFQNSSARVQYAWRSAHGQLHLLASAGGKNYLVQTRRLASYLQAGLLVPLEDEALTVRATREALGKLAAHPNQLLQ
ncbi:DUF1631 family protein [Ottowia sp.]|uniref:DUF1631 family protein n=1 Tax=Ottowia sp. TaxID=1898956 RepID=UPI003A8946B3